MKEWDKNKDGALSLKEIAGAVSKTDGKMSLSSLDPGAPGSLVSVLMKGAWNLLLIMIVVFFAKGIIEHFAQNEEERRRRVRRRKRSSRVASCARAFSCVASCGRSFFAERLATLAVDCPGSSLAASIGDSVPSTVASTTR